MSPVARALDRVVLSLLALLLLAAGLAGIAWATRTVGWLPWPHAVRTLPGTVSLAAAQEQTRTSWWPWALLVAGIVLVLLSLRWLVAHLPVRRVGHLRLPGDDTGRLLVDGRSVVDAAAVAYNSYPGVDSAVGSLDLIDSRLVARVQATIERDADLIDLGRAADEVSAQLRQVVGRDDLAMSFVLRVAPVSSSRVE